MTVRTKRGIIFFFSLLIIVSIFNLILVSDAEAGLISSFIDKIFGSSGQGGGENIELNQNSQTASALMSVLNFNPATDNDNTSITIVNQSALVANVGPLGSLADIKANESISDRISIYVVREGDNLIRIADMFDVSVNTIMSANDIKKGDVIQPGEVLIILPVTGIQYTVKAGDTAASIAKKFNADAEEIINFNNLSDGVLAVGLEIIIPDGQDGGTVSPSGTSVITPIAKLPALSQQNVSPVKNYSGYYMRPIDGGRRSQGIHGHNAVDLAISCGSPIFAAATGDVIIARNYGWNSGYGNYIVVEHPNGSQTLYAHLSETIVTTGWHVVQGQIIGYVGTTGKSTGCHLHFEIRNGIRNPF